MTDFLIILLALAVYEIGKWFMEIVFALIFKSDIESFRKQSFQDRLEAEEKRVKETENN